MANNYRISIPALTALLISLMACEEGKRYEISSGDNTIPGKPIFVDSKPINGGSRVYFLSPDDEDFLYVEASYLNHEGETVSCIASYFSDSLDVLGFKDPGEHIIDMCSVDRSGNKSEKIQVSVLAGESPINRLARTVDVIPSFGSIMLSWKNPLLEPLYIYANIKYSLGGEEHDFTRVISTSAADTRSIDSLKLYKGEDLHLTVTVKDKYKNTAVPIRDTVLNLLVDNKISKERWTLPEPGTVMGGVTQSDGSYNKGHFDDVIDDVTEAGGEINFYEAKPSSKGTFDIIIDLGAEYELSRVVTHQRYSGAGFSGNASNIRGNYYGGKNVTAYRMYIWNETSLSWEYISRHEIYTPVVKQQEDYKILGDRGDMAYLYPERPGFSPKTRYFRYEALNGEYLSEITLYGKQTE